MNKHRSIKFILIFTILMIAAGAATIGPNMDAIDQVNIQDLRGAAKFQAMQELQP